MNCGLVINCSDQEFIQSLGSLGVFTIPACKKGEKYALLVVRPATETIDEGFNKSHGKTWDGAEVAKDVCGMNSDRDGRYSRFGVLLCSATPTFPAEIEDIERKDAENYRVRIARLKAGNSTPVESEESAQKRSDRAHEIWVKFVADAHKLIKAEEIAEARRNHLTEAQRLVVQGDTFWARPADQKNITDTHRRACILLGQERPWCYTPSSLCDCPGCGGKIKENVIKCPHCQAVLEYSIEEYAKMSPKEKAMSLYPERYAQEDAEPVTVTGKGQGKP